MLRYNVVGAIPAIRIDVSITRATCGARSGENTDSMYVRRWVNSVRKKIVRADMSRGMAPNFCISWLSGANTIGQLNVHT
eukprot:2467714-Rhodomonas_salina.1